ncbi:MAG TPA: InlB B-repeat-containing protein [Clostridiales bacterium]|nr:InlB B-repeat-containing protein [Clostridiales bacterium]
MKKGLSFKRSAALTLILSFVLAFGAMVGVNQEVTAKTGILGIDVTYALGDGPAASDVTMPSNTTWDLGNTTLAAAPTCTNNNFKFVKWADAEDNLYDPGDTYEVKGTPSALTFTAVWQVAVTYNINLDDADESIATPAADSAYFKKDYKIEDKYTLTANYYTFQGWSTQADAITAEYKPGDTIKAATVTGPITLYAVWDQKFYSVIYRANTDSEANDSAVSVPVDKTKYMDDNLTVTVMGNSGLASTNANYKNMTDATPTRTGYTFAGWATSATATTAEYQPGATFAISKNMELFAVWTAGAATTAATSTTPQTGSSDQLMLYITLALLCLTGIGYLCYDQRKAKVTK